MKAAVISFTEDGRKLSARIAGVIGAERFCFSTHSDRDSRPFSDLAGLMSDLFTDYSALIFVCAAGIAVRAVAPHVRSKLTDPAVVAVDDCGRFAVPLLSGHLGGANALAELIAGNIGAVAVITTSTDSHGLFSPDIFAKKNGLVICDMTAAKAVAAAVIDGRPVGVRCVYPHSKLPKELTLSESGDIGICISGDASEKPFGVTLNLLPKDLTVGIGCKRGTPEDAITAHVMSVFSGNGLDIRRLAKAATIVIKADEAGLLGFCERFSVPLVTFSADELMSVHGNFSHSEFVEKTTGADNICERAAVCAGGKLIVGRTAGNGVTAAVACAPVFIDFRK